MKRCTTTLALGALCFVSIAPRASAQTPPSQLPIEQQPGVTIIPAPGTAPAPVPAPAPAAPQPQAAPVQPMAPAAPPQRRIHVWYGYQTLIVDAIAFGAGTVGFALKEPTLQTVGVAGYLAGPPVIHFIHGHVGRGFGDFGVRCGFPVAGLLVGLIVGAVVAAKDDSSVQGVSDDIARGIEVGTVAGVVGAIIFDAAVFGDETVLEGAEDARVHPPLPTFRVAPTAFTARGGGGLGLGGTF
jgi:hypothetical protein